MGKKQVNISNTENEFVVFMKEKNKIENKRKRLQEDRDKAKRKKKAKQSIIEGDEYDG